MPGNRTSEDLPSASCRAAEDLGSSRYLTGRRLPPCGHSRFREEVSSSYPAQRQLTSRTGTIRDSLAPAVDPDISGTRQSGNARPPGYLYTASGGNGSCGNQQWDVRSSWSRLNIAPATADLAERQVIGLACQCPKDYEIGIGRPVGHNVMRARPGQCCLRSLRLRHRALPVPFSGRREAAIPFVFRKSWVRDYGLVRLDGLL